MLLLIYAGLRHLSLSAATGSCTPGGQAAGLKEQHKIERARA